MSRFDKVGLHRPLRLRRGNHRHRWDLAAVSRCLRCESGRCDLPTSAPNVCETRGRESWTSKLCLTCVPDGMVGERGRDQVARNCRHTWRIARGLTSAVSASVFTCTGYCMATLLLCAMPRASLRSLLLICADSAAF